LAFVPGGDQAFGLLKHLWISCVPSSRFPLRGVAVLILLSRGGRSPSPEFLFLSQQSSIDQHGLAGLRTTRIQQYRML
jgi:hypothetical protein